MLFDPERPAEPQDERESAVWDHCSCCGNEIYVGDMCYQNPWNPNEYICNICYIDMREVIAGDE